MFIKKRKISEVHRLTVKLSDQSRDNIFTTV